MVVIGPRYGQKPIGVCLSEEDLGSWIDMHGKEGEERVRTKA